MKDIIVISFILLAGLASAYTPEQQTILDAMNLSSQLSIAHEEAVQGQNIAEFNILVDKYNAWIREHFGEDTRLLKSKMDEPSITPATYSEALMPETSGGSYTLTTKPFNTSSDLSKFGNQRTLYAPQTSYTEEQNENAISQLKAERFLNS